MRVRKLLREDDRNRFESGDVEIDRFNGFVPLDLALGHSETRPAPTPMFLPIETLIAAGR